MMCVEPARGIYSHIIGIDIVRTAENEFFVLEDNTRTPSGVSYMLENREAMMHMFPELFARNRVAAVEDYPDNLRLTLESVAPEGLDREPTVVVLTPGIYNSAYFEHSFLADQMGVELVEGQDLVVLDGALQMKTTQGLKQVDVVYRRIDDAFLDPLVFQQGFGARRARHLRRLPRRPADHRQRARRRHRRRQVDLHLHARHHRVLHRPPADPEERADLRLPQARRPQLRARAPGRAGGQAGARLGRLRHAGRARPPPRTRSRCSRMLVKARPDRYIAQPTLALSTCPTLVEQGIAERHLDLRPFVLVGDRVRLTPGGLTRVALREGSLVVNSSQGGGTKDTWVLQD